MFGGGPHRRWHRFRKTLILLLQSGSLHRYSGCWLLGLDGESLSELDGLRRDAGVVGSGVGANWNGLSKEKLSEGEGSGATKLRSEEKDEKVLLS